MRNIVLIVMFGLTGLNLFAQEAENRADEKFAQLYDQLPTPNVYHAASGAPGHEYYQQKADYIMDIELDDEKQILYGTSTITYTNNSPDELPYLWLQLDQNIRAQNSDTRKTKTFEMSDKMNVNDFKNVENDFDGGFKIQYVKDNSNKDLPHVINNTMMRVDLPKPLKAKGKVSLKIKWWYNINDRMKMGGRSGYEYFEKDDNYLYTIAQFFPRMCVYNDHEGWQNKQFLGNGEFTLPFGDYKVNLTVPADHVVGATGFCQNYSSVLSPKHLDLFNQAKDADEPLVIITQDEAEENEKEGTTEKKTWTYKASNVRDFAFASSRKFVWDAMGVEIGGRKVMAMSYYPKEGNPLWEQYSTRAVAQTLRTYSKHTIDYPYPVAISVHAKSIGMEYPMICFNFGRPEEDGTYSEETKNRMIMVIIHEVGHNFFPMIINSDERQWTWMDEGLNTFTQYLTEREWDKNFKSRRGPAHKITDYMSGSQGDMVPIMTNSESLIQFGNNAYGKPATALNILRETVMGRELFDFAYREYSRRWAFRHPSPADFFRTMEDASAVDLDWFWRGWFYTTDNCDQSLDGVKWFKADTKDPAKENTRKKEEAANEKEHITTIRNKDVKTVADNDPKSRDFYYDYDAHKTTILDVEDYEKYKKKMGKSSDLIDPDKNYYQVDLSNVGELVMPVILELEFTDGSREEHRIPAEIWRRNDKKVSKVFVTEKELVRVALDPHLEVADVDRGNNYWPARAEPTRFELFKDAKKPENTMQRDRRAKKKAEK
ncbi:MAG: hypothetical protein ACI9FU_001351 [Granulosicoccus sp.]|jgi:hypothetical protein